MNHGTLLSHVDTDIVTRAELMGVPAPEPTCHLPARTALRVDRHA
jgi:hypothetical protein